MIEAKAVYFTYRSGVEALKDVSVTIKDGEFVAIMGQNGAGKTTLVKHFNGLLKPTKGQVLVNNVDVSKVSIATLSKNVGFVFQNPDHQLFSETVEEEISFALRNFGFEETNRTQGHRHHRRSGALQSWIRAQQFRYQFRLQVP